MNIAPGFQKGWRERRDRAKARSVKITSAYREQEAEITAQAQINARFAAVQLKHQRLVDEMTALERELVYYTERAAEDKKIIGPSHPVVLRLAAIKPLIAEAAKALKPAQVIRDKHLAESAARLAEIQARHKAAADMQSKADAAAQAAYDAAMGTDKPKRKTKPEVETEDDMMAAQIMAAARAAD